MTDSNRVALVFSNLGRRRIEADFAGGKLTSDAGTAPLREVDRRIGLIDALPDCITDPRQPAKITHHLRTMLAQRILAMAMGYEDLNDHDSLRDDRVVFLLGLGRAVRTKVDGLAVQDDVGLAAGLVVT